MLADSEAGAQQTSVSPPLPSFPVGCERLIAFVHVTVLSPERKPVPKAEFNVFRLRDSANVASAYVSVESEGTYQLIDDTDLQLVSEKGETFRLVVRTPTSEGRADFVIGRRSCHVWKLHGPAAIILRKRGS